MLARRTRLATLTALAAALAGSACGREDIQLAPFADDASAREAGVDADVTGALPGNDASPPTCDASAPPPVCRALGEACGSASDCCSTHCTSGACVATGACAGASAPCATPSDCCSGRCEPKNGSTALACLAECRPDGAACAGAADCCALDCNGGVCGAAECLQEGNDCTTSAQCCSNLCDPAQGNKCAIDPVATCRPSGEDCSSGGKGNCCDVCDGNAQRCDPGPGPCRPLGAICSRAADCCNGAACTANAGGASLCTAPLLADGASCQAGFECASVSCGGNPPACGAPLAACVPSGGACGEADGGACCSGLCAGGVCQSGCVPATR